MTRLMALLVAGFFTVPAFAGESVERDYLVKGMTCGGCVIGVKKALERAGVEKDQIIEVDYRSPDPKNKIGHAKVHFPKEQFKGQETDCKIAKAIKDHAGFSTYWESANTNPCQLN